MSLTMTQWDALDEYDRAWVLASDVADLEREAEAAKATCSACGGQASECQDPDNQHAFVVSLKRCYRTRAVQDAMKSRRSDPDVGSLLVSVSLDPTRKKSARKG